MEISNSLLYQPKLRCFSSGCGWPAYLKLSLLQKKRCGASMRCPPKRRRKTHRGIPRPLVIWERSSKLADQGGYDGTVASAFSLQCLLCFGSRIAGSSLGAGAEDHFCRLAASCNNQ